MMFIFSDYRNYCSIRKNFDRNIFCLGLNQGPKDPYQLSYTAHLSLDLDT